MREIKFRAWDTEKVKMYEVAKVDMWGNPDQATCDLAAEDEELFDIYLNEVNIMQYTGLHDKNGKEIYEGDLLRVQKTPDNPTVYVVFYADISCAYLLDNVNNPYKPTLASCYNLKIEVIGNVFEHPDLLMKVGYE